MVRLEMSQLIEVLLGEYSRKMVNMVGLLRQVGAFSPFEDAQLRMLLDKAEPLRLRKGDFLYKEGNASKCFYLLTKG